MTACCICVGEREADPGYLACPRCAGRLSGALRQIPVLVDELHGLGYVERDVRPLRCSMRDCPDRATTAGFIERDGVRGSVRRYCDRHWTSTYLAAYEAGGRLLATAEYEDPAPADPVANGLTAGPTKSTWSESRIRSTRPERLPIAVDPTDLLMPARRGSLAVHAGPYGADQDGHLSVATVLDFWVRDWADLRREGLPPLRTRERSQPVAVLAGWLADRLPWALQHHMALDEFAGDVARLAGALYALAGLGAARPKLMEAPCPACEMPTLVQPFPEANIECGDPTCGRVLTPLEYEEMVMEMRHEITAQDVLLVLNGLEPVKLDGLRFVVITTGYTETPSHRLGELAMVEHEERWWPFERGEIVVVNSSGREPFGEGRKPSKWSVGREEFDRLEDALARRERLLSEAV